MKRQFTSRDYTPKHADVYAARYDDGVHDVKVRVVRRFLRDIRGQTVLDLGCGVGNFAALVADLGAKPIACDFAEAMITRTAQRYAHRFPVVRGSAEAPPFPAGRFDLVLAFDVIEHLYHPQAMLTRVRALLKPGGRLLLTTDNVQPFYVGFLPKYARDWRQRWFGGSKDNVFAKYDTPLCTHVREYRFQELVNMAEAAGFALASYDTYSLRPRYSLFGRMVEFALRGPLRLYKWDYVICEFVKQTARPAIR
ncbi:MAG: class I SAM-dependent methyltransferase [Chloroflexi bacterium]|nr:class I SAM-dependent methyltransferase [Chloroflexota bacterium]